MKLRIKSDGSSAAKPLYERVQGNTTVAETAKNNLIVCGKILDSYSRKAVLLRAFSAKGTIVVHERYGSITKNAPLENAIIRMVERNVAVGCQTQKNIKNQKL